MTRKKSKQMLVYWFRQADLYYCTKHRIECIYCPCEHACDIERWRMIRPEFKFPQRQGRLVSKYFKL